MAESVATSLKLDPALKQRLKRLAAVRDRTPHWLMTHAIEEYLDREEKRERLRTDLIAAWDHYQDTGLHLTADEADAWLARLAAGETDDPECHV
jgi:predicted transcriptional regulator